MTGDRRRAPREFRVLQATGRTGEGTEVDGTIENLSVGGAFFVCEDPRSPVKSGDQLVIEIPYRLEESAVEAGILRCPGEILRVEEYGAGAGAMRACAVRFRQPVLTFGYDLGED